MLNPRSCLFVPVALVFAMAGRAVADIVVTAEAPGVQASAVAGVLTMDFNSTPVGSYTTLASAIGTYTAPGPGLAVVNPDEFGGANQTRYLVVGQQSGQLQATLSLASSAAYFGFYWPAGDPGNTIQFFQAGTLLAAFNVGSIIPLLQRSGGPYGSGHFGNPNTREDGGEPFVYLNFIGTNGVVFDQVRFLNVGLGSGFETDNHSFRAAPLGGTLPGTRVGVITVQGVPEPASMILVISGLVGVAGRAWSRRSARSPRSVSGPSRRPGLDRAGPRGRTDSPATA